MFYNLHSTLMASPLYTGEKRYVEKPSKPHLLSHCSMWHALWASTQGFKCSFPICLNATECEAGNFSIMGSAQSKAPRAHALYLRELCHVPCIFSLPHPPRDSERPGIPNPELNNLNSHLYDLRQQGIRFHHQTNENFNGPNIF